MTIAVHISAGKHEDLSDNFNFVCFSELAIAQPDSHFIFIFDCKPHPELYLEQNCTPVILLPTLKNNLLRHYWYSYKLPAIIQRYNADILITAGPTCSFRIKIPQCLMLKKGEITVAEKRLYLKKFMPVFFETASHIFTTDPGTLQTLQGKYSLQGKSSLLFPGLKNETRPATYEEREAIKKEYTRGNEYFLYAVSDNDFEKVKTVLKAFSIFKKWQKSSMLMVLLVRPEIENTILKELALYKHRDEVLLVKTNFQSIGLITSAYGIISGTTELLSLAVPAMKSGVPVIINENQNTRESLQGALQTTWHEKNISEKMMNLYKDEHMRNEVIKEGLDTTLKYSWKSTTEKLWNTFQLLVN